MERLLTVLSAMGALCCSTAAWAGPLDPPGAPGPTMKTLDEVEPSIPVGPETTPGDADARFVINQPGAYHLTADLIAEQGRHGVQILADDVTLDLRGFTLRGDAGALDGVRAGEDAGALLTNIVVRNGRAVGWGGSGVRLNRANRASVERVFSVGNGAYGVLAGTGARVTDCTAEGNTLTNISVAGQSIVEGCLSLRGGADGFTGAATSVFQRCVAFLNQGDGFRPGSGATLTDCIASGNQGDGFDAGARVVFERCVSLFDLGRGIVAGLDSTARGCTITGAGQDGITLGARGVVTGSTVAMAGGAGVTLGDSGRALHSTIAASAGTGVAAGLGGRIEGCVVRGATIGVSADEGGTVHANTVGDIAQDGVRVTGRCTVSANTIDQCGTAPGFDGAGVRATGSGSRIENNSATRCDFAYRLDAGGNLVIGNSASEFSISAFSAASGNAVGPILDSGTIAASPAANANFIH